MRPDGGHNICYASVISPDVKKPMYFDSMLRWCGPCWNANQHFTLWQIATEWSSYEIKDNYSEKANRILAIISEMKLGNSVSDESNAFLGEAGILKTEMQIDGNNGWFKSVPQVVWLENTDINNELIVIGDRIKEKYWTELQAMRAPYIKAVLDATPKNLHTMQKYGLQYTFFSDGWFILHL